MTVVGSAQSPAECSFFTKVQVAQTTKAEAIIVMNERDSSAITMDTTKDNGELSCVPTSLQPVFHLFVTYTIAALSFLPPQVLCRYLDTKQFHLADPTHMPSSHSSVLLPYPDVLKPQLQGEFSTCAI